MAKSFELPVLDPYGLSEYGDPEIDVSPELEFVMAGTILAEAEGLRRLINNETIVAETEREVKKNNNSQK